MSSETPVEEEQRWVARGHGHATLEIRRKLPELRDGDSEWRVCCNPARALGRRVLLDGSDQELVGGSIESRSVEAVSTIVVTSRQVSRIVGGSGGTKSSVFRTLGGETLGDVRRWLELVGSTSG